MQLITRKVKILYKAIELSTCILYLLRDGDLLETFYLLQILEE